MRKKLAIISVLAFSVLAGACCCKDDSTPAVSGTGSGTTVVPSAAQPIASLTGTASADFSSQPALHNTLVALDYDANADVDASMARNETDLQVRIPTDKTLTVTVEQQPEGEGIPISIDLRSLPAIGMDQNYGAYAWQPLDGDSGETSTLQTLSSTYDADTRSLSFTAPPETFHLDPDSKYRARLKIGLAERFDPLLGVTPLEPVPEQVSSPRSKDVFNGSSDALIPCPLLRDCLEISRFGPRRGESRAATGHHNGIDLRAAAGEQVFAPEGSVLLAGVSPSAYARDTRLSEGISIKVGRLNPNPMRLGYFHLGDAVSPGLLTEGGDYRVGTIIKRSAVGTSCNTGKGRESRPACDHQAESDPKYHVFAHLHLRVQVGTPTCRRQGGELDCGFRAAMEVDPFERLMAEFRFVEGSPGRLEMGQEFLIAVQGTTIDGRQLRSDMTDDSTPVSRRRKLCVRDAAGKLAFPGLETQLSPTTDTAMRPVVKAPSGDLCADWGLPIVARAVKPGVTELQVRYSTSPPEARLNQLSTANSLVARHSIEVGGASPPQEAGDDELVCIAQGAVPSGPPYPPISPCEVPPAAGNRPDGIYNATHPSVDYAEARDYCALYVSPNGTPNLYKTAYTWSFCRPGNRSCIDWVTASTSGPGFSSCAGHRPVLLGP